MPIIENVAAADIPTAAHFAAGDNSMLIQIMDVCPRYWPTPKHQFKEIHQFEFLDSEDRDHEPEEAKISMDQAREIVALLQRALADNMNVVVHCVAGLCRSGAVCEVGVMMGFADTGRFRSPNLRVKHYLMKVLGWTYDESEEFSSNGRNFYYDELNNKVFYDEDPGDLAFGQRFRSSFGDS